MADALVLGASSPECGFKSHLPHQNKMAKKMSSAFLPMTSPFIGLFRQRYPRSKTHRFWGYHLPFLLPSVYSNFHLPISLQKSRNTIKKVNAKSGRI